MTAADQTTEPVDVSELPPTQYLIMEVLAARYRTGATYWTFPNPCATYARKLENAGLIWCRNGPAPECFEARFTDAGRAAALVDGYVTPNDKAASAEALRDKLVVQLAETIADLDGFIARRADEIAAPRIAEAAQVCHATVSELKQTYALHRQLWTDLKAELRRQLATQLRMADRYIKMLRDNGVNPLTGMKEKAL